MWNHNSKVSQWKCKYLERYALNREVRGTKEGHRIAAMVRLLAPVGAWWMKKSMRIFFLLVVLNDASVNLNIALNVMNCRLFFDLGEVLLKGCKQTTSKSGCVDEMNQTMYCSDESNL